MERIEVHKTLSSWGDLVDTEQEFSQQNAEWVFRGEAIRRQPKTTLQRVCEEFDIPRRAIPQFEAELLRQFRRNYFIYANSLARSDQEDTIYWLSLMRHYGSPTRLLDFTYSFFIATFFALEKPVPSDPLPAQNTDPAYEPSAIWAISKS